MALYQYKHDPIAYALHIRRLDTHLLFATLLTLVLLGSLFFMAVKTGVIDPSAQESTLVGLLVCTGLCTLLPLTSVHYLVGHIVQQLDMVEDKTDIEQRARYTRAIESRVERSLYLSWVAILMTVIVIFSLLPIYSLFAYGLTFSVIVLTLSNAGWLNARLLSTKTQPCQEECYDAA